MTNPTQDPEAEAPAFNRNEYTVNPEQASTNFYWTAGKQEQFNLQTTLRGVLSDDDIRAHVETAIAGMKTVISQGGHAKTVTPKGEAVTAPVPQTTPTQAAIETGKAVPTAAAITSSPYETPMPASQVQTQKQMLELVIAEVEITPHTDGKAELKFFAAGHKFPDLYSTKPVGTWAQVLGWAESNFRETKRVSAPLRIQYTLSEKLNSKGNPYKDIQAIFKV